MGEASVVTLIGRDSERGILTALLDDVATGAARTVFIEGEAGIGKSRLVEELLAGAAARGFATFRGAADELERDRPFRALAEALDLEPRSADADRAEIGRLLYGTPSGAAPFTPSLDMSFRITESVLGLVESIASVTPVIVALEDLHWAETSTIGAARALGRRLGHLPLLLVLTARPSPRSTDLDRALESLIEAGARTMTLEPLAEDAVMALTKELASGTPGRYLRGQVAGAGGNPLFVIELLRALRDEGAIVIADGHADVAEIAIPPSLRLTILRRMSVLSPDTLDTLRLAAVLGAAFSLSELSLVATRSIVQLFASLQPALDAGFIGERDARLAFRHDLIREAIYEDLPLAVRTALHREVGQALARAGAPAARVAEHAYLGAMPGDPDAIAWLRKAAREMSSRSLVVARDWMERALHLTPQDDPQRDAIVAELIPSLSIMGLSDEVRELASTVLDRTSDPAVMLAVRRGLAHGFAQRGAFAAAIEQTTEAKSIAGLSDADRAELTGLSSMFLLFGADADRAETEADAAIDAAAATGAEYAQFLGLHTKALVAAARGYVAEAVEHVDHMSAMAPRMRTPWSGYLVTDLYRGVVLVDADRIDEAREAYDAGRRLAEERGGTPFLPVYQWSLARVKYFTGAWDDAIAEIETGMRIAEDIGQRWQILPYGIIARIAIHRDDLQGASAALTEAERALSEAGPQLGFDWMMWCRALLLEANGDVDAAAAVMSNAWTAFAPLRYLVNYRSIAPDAVRLLLAAGDHARAEAVTRDVEEGAVRGAVATAEAVALRCRGLLDDDADAMIGSVALYKKGPRVTETAAAAEDAGRVAGRAGMTREAVGLLSDALEAYESMDAHRDATRANALLRDLGVRRRRRGPGRTAAVGWDSLTRTEREVAELAAQGLTNRQVGARLFISPRTVETHLSHVFGKLAISTRVELATVVARRATEPR